MWPATIGVVAPAGAANTSRPVAVIQASRTVCTPAIIRAGSPLLFDPALVFDGEAERISDPALQLGGDGVATAGRDDLAELDLEVEALRARRAPVEVSGDHPPPPDGELTVEVVIHPMERLFAIHPRAGPQSPPVPSRVRIRTHRRSPVR